MQIRSFALALAAGASTVAAYPITADGVNCRTGPGTSFSVVRTYNAGVEVTLECATHGENIFGQTIWDKTTDGCYVSDYYVSTGSEDMVVGQCEEEDNGGSEYQGPITREEIIARGQTWVDQKVPYSMTAVHPDPNGRNYRTDCSGFVSMALHAWAPGYNTVSLPEIATAIGWEDLLPGDFVGTLGEGTGGAAGHVTLFLEWANEAHTSYVTLECRGTYGCVKYERPVAWTVGSFTAAPYRYNKLA